MMVHISLIVFKGAEHVIKAAVVSSVGARLKFGIHFFFLPFVRKETLRLNTEPGILSAPSWQQLSWEEWTRSI